VDWHLKVAGELVEGDLSLAGKLARLPKVALTYAVWYPSRWLGWGWWPRFASYGELGKHMRFIDRNSRKLARVLFHKMIRYGAQLPKKQAVLFRAVDIGAELFAMTATIGKAHMLKKKGAPEADEAIRLADLYCRMSQRHVKELFRGLRSNDDVKKYDTARRVLDGELEWLEEGIVYPPADWVPGEPMAAVETRAAAVGTP
jgi:hypothetical protein